MRNKFSLISVLAPFCFFHFFFLLAPSRGSCTYAVLLPENAWKMDLWWILLPLHACLLHPLGKSSSILWPISTSLLCFSLGFSARDIFIFLWHLPSLLCFPCSFQGLLFFLWLWSPCFSSCHGVSDCSGRRPASCSSVKQSSLFQYPCRKPKT